MIPKNMALGESPSPESEVKSLLNCLLLFWTALRASRDCVGDGDFEVQGSRGIL